MQGLWLWRASLKSFLILETAPFVARRTPLSRFWVKDCQSNLLVYFTWQKSLLCKLLNYVFRIRTYTRTCIKRDAWCLLEVFNNLIDALILRRPCFIPKHVNANKETKYIVYILSLEQLLVSNIYHYTE